MLTELQMDALREVTNIGCGAAATALSQLLGGRPVKLEVTRSRLLSLWSLESLLGGADDTRVTIHLALRGGFEGRLLLTYECAGATDMALFLAGPSAASGDDELSEIGCSALMEVGNIVGSAFLNAVGKVSGLILVPSVPTLAQGRVSDVLSSLRLASDHNDKDRMLVLETRLLAEGGRGMNGHVIIVPRPEGLMSFLHALGLV